MPKHRDPDQIPRYHGDPVEQPKADWLGIPRRLGKLGTLLIGYSFYGTLILTAATAVLIIGAILVSTVLN